MTLKPPIVVGVLCLLGVAMHPGHRGFSSPKDLPASRLVAGASSNAEALTTSELRQAPSPPASPRANSRWGVSFARFPLPFEPNQGQTDPQVDFLARGRGYTLFLTPMEAVLTLESATVLRMKLLGANPRAKAAGRERLPTRVNYFRGNDPKKWATDVPTYARVRYPQVYPGIDLVYYGNSGQLEYDFIVAPGADPNAIRLAFEGTEELEIGAEGDLVVHLPAGDLRFHKPQIFQETKNAEPLGSRLGDVQGNLVREEIAGQYTLLAKNQVGFQVGSYDPSRPLIIDPVLSYSTFLGGSGEDGGASIAVDSLGNTYVTGGTLSTNFPTETPLQPNFAGGNVPCNDDLGFECGDVFVTKIDVARSTLLYSTYLGGSDEDFGLGIAVDAAGSAYVTGATDSNDFPTSPGAFDRTCGTDGNCNLDEFGFTEDDAFVAKLSSDGSTLIYSTYLGGSEEDTGVGIAVDAVSNAYVTGATDSNDFPTSPGAFDRTCGPTGNCDPAQDEDDAFVAKLSTDGSTLLYSTYLGGSDEDFGLGIAVDAAGRAYVTGATFSTDFPTANAVQPANAGGTCGDPMFPEPCSDAFVTKLNADGSALVYSTYLGGSNAEGIAFPVGIAVDASGNAYLTAQTNSADFPTTAGAFQTTFGGGAPFCEEGFTLCGDAFVTKVNPSGSALVYSTFLGGADDDAGLGIALDTAGNAYVAGGTASTNFPTANPIQPANAGGTCGEPMSPEPCIDAFVTKLNADGSVLVHSTYFGGSGHDVASDIALDPFGRIYVAGATAAADFPTANPFQGAQGGGELDAFVAKLSEVPNDVDNAAPIPTPSFSDTVDTTSATTDPSDPTPSCGGGSRDNSVWYQFTPDNDGIIHLDSLESDYDTIVSVWTGEPGSLNEVACDDDGESREDNSGSGSGGGALVLAQTIPAGNSSVSFPANGGTTYFIMVSGKGGGGGLTISLAFQASNNPLPPNTVGTIIPHSALGGGFLSRVFITNLSNNLNRVVINRVGQPGSVIDSASTFLEPAATAQVAASEAARTGDLTVEWFTIGSEGDVASSLLFEFDSASLGLEENFRTAVGTLAAESLSAFTVPVRVATVEVTVGLALADLSGSSNTVNLTLRDQNGATVAQDSLTLAAFEQTAFSLQDRAAFSDIILGVPEFIGSLAVETADPNQSVAAIVIGNNLRQLYALPVIPGVAGGSGSTLRAPATHSMVTRSRPAPGLAQAIPAGNFTTLIPHSAAGGGFLSRLFVVNLTGNTNNLTINRIGQDGSVVTTTDAMLAPAGTLMLPDDEAVRGENLTIEWFAIGSEMPIGASLLFEFDSESLGLEENFLTAVGSLAADPLSSFTTPIRVATVDVTAGVALANPNDASTTVNLELLNQGGTVVAQDSLTLGAFEQTAFSLQDRAAFSSIILGVPEFIGALAVTTTDANRPVAALVIGNNLGQLFALPVTPGVAQ